MFPFQLLNIALDEHPLDADRMNFAINDLKKELDRTDLKPYVRQQILQDAKEMEEGLNTYRENISKIGKNKMLSVYTEGVIKLFGGTLRGKLIGKNVNTDIDDFIEEIDN